MSLALALNVTVAWPPPVHSAVMGAGTVTTGRVVSCTVTVKLALPVFWCESVAVQVTVVVPTGKHAPDGGAQITVALPQLSIAVGGV